MMKLVNFLKLRSAATMIYKFQHYQLTADAKDQNALLQQLSDLNDQMSAMALQNKKLKSDNKELKSDNMELKSEKKEQALNAHEMRKKLNFIMKELLDSIDWRFISCLY
jgi:DNA repair exonuclease SbcCD ATPase subunit